MKKIALMRMPSTYANWYRHPAMGLAYLASYGESRGAECRIFDAYFEGWSRETLVDQVAAYQPDLIGMTAMTHEIAACAEVARSVKQSIDAPVVVGGCHVSALPHRTLEEYPAFDFGITGEGELPFADLVERWRPGSDRGPLSQIRGLVMRNGDEIVFDGGGRHLTSAELDDLPMPAFDKYFGTDRRALAGPDDYYTVMSSRGCPYRCTFCMRVLGQKVRRRSTERLLAEIEYAVEHYGAHTFNFSDEILLMKTRRTTEILEAMIESGLSRRIRWNGLTRADMVTDELVALAKRAGCVKLEMGVESGDDHKLQAMNKRITVDQVRKAVRIIKRHGISLGTYFIIGHPNETERSANRTVDLAVELNTDTIAVGAMVPYPGTRIYEMARQGLGGYTLLTEDWSTYDKYGGRALQLDNLSLSDIVALQRKAYLKFYFKNRRIREMARFTWDKRNAFYFFARQRIARGSVQKPTRCFEMKDPARSTGIVDVSGSPSLRSSDSCIYRSLSNERTRVGVRRQGQFFDTSEALRITC